MTIKEGSKVVVEYEGRFESGEIFDTSSHGDHSHPLEFEVGKGQVIKGFEEAVVGLEKGGEKEVKIPADKAYGQPDPRLIQKIPLNTVPNSDQLKKGARIIISNPQGQKFPALISDIDKENVSLDLNHPLAGKTLIFKIKVINYS